MAVMTGMAGSQLTLGPEGVVLSKHQPRRASAPDTLEPPSPKSPPSPTRVNLEMRSVKDWHQADEAGMETDLDAGAGVGDGGGGTGP